jgi:hypothetical protein
MSSETYRWRVFMWGQEGGEGAGLRARAAVALAISLAALLALTCTPTWAAQTRKVVNTFGSLSNPQGLAIDQENGDVYVADTANHRIIKFDALGNQLLGFGADVGGAGVKTCSLVCEPGTAGSAPGQFTTAEFVAVDNSSGPSARDVYVADTGDNLISKFDSSGNLISSWGAGGQLSGSTTTAGSFGALAGVAVDSSGTLRVINTESRLFDFEQDGTFTTEVTVDFPSVANGLGVDGSGNLFKVNSDGSVLKLGPSGSDIGFVSPDGNPTPVTTALAVEPTSGELYLTTAEGSLDHYVFNGSGEVLEPGGSTCNIAPGSVGCFPSDSFATAFAASGIAVRSGNGDAYVSDPTTGQILVYAVVTVPDVSTEAAVSIEPKSATLNGTVNPDAIQLTNCHFEYGTSTAYGQSVPCVPSAASIPPDSNPHAVSAQISGLEPGATYHFRLVAGNENGSNPAGDQSFSPPPPPSIDSATVSELSASSAKLNAKINPRGNDTHYRFEYGISTAYGTSVPIPDADIGSGEGDVSVAQRLAGLSAGTTTYHWRVIAINFAGTTTSTDHTFIYQSAGPSLPDSRAYEMVTPPQKNGTLIGDVLVYVPDVATSGSRVIAGSIQCFADAQSCIGHRNIAVGSPYAFTRTSSGWVATAMAPPASQLPVSAHWGSSADAATALFSAPTEPFGEDDFYARQADGTFLHIGPVTPPAGGAKGPEGGVPAAHEQALSADLSHVVWEVEKPGFWPSSLDATTGETSLYEYAGATNSQPLLVGVSGGQSSKDVISRCGTRLGGPNGNGPAGAMSTDGRTVYFTAIGREGCEGSGANAGTAVPANQLYARVDGELAAAHTVAISARSPSDCTGACLASPPGDAQFMGASADSSIAFFTSTQQLTDQASEDSHGGDSAFGNHCWQTTGENGCNLYLYDFQNPAGQQLIDVSAGDSSGEGPRVQGAMAISADGSHAYLVAKGVLTSAANAQGQKAGNGANNLYVYERDTAHPGGQVAFIASLPGVDKQEWAEGAGTPANVTPDGRYLVFLSHGDLTPDDTSASGAQQVFRYDAQSGALARMSIGEEGFNDNGNRSSPTPCDVGGCAEDAVLAFGRARRDPTMSDDGAYVFFTSPVALTAQALDDVQISSNGAGNPIYAQNVYEWHAGHVALISVGRDVSVTSSGNPHCGFSSVCLLGSDASGSNVFFSTTDQLSSQDTDTALDFYDARICAAADPCITPPSTPISCQGDVCQGAPSSQPGLQAAATIAFTGPGNAKAAGVPLPGKVRILSHTIHGSTFTLTVKVPGKGRISISGAGVGTLKRSVAAAGTYRFALRLTRRARSSLRHKHKLKVKLQLGYTPSSGASSTATVALTVKR